jgi:hypothetical protein
MEEHRLTKLQKMATVKYLNFTLNSNSVVVISYDERNVVTCPIHPANKVIKSWIRPWSGHGIQIHQKIHGISTQRLHDITVRVYYVALRAGFNSLEGAMELSSQAQGFG